MNQHAIWKQLKFATGNPNKLREAREILGIDLDQVTVEHLHEIQTHDVRKLVEHKAVEAWEELNCPVLVEDSGLIFEAWNGLPGALVKWFEQSVGCGGMLKMLEPFENRQAVAVCLTAVYDGKNLIVGEGRVAGTVAAEIRGTRGFGWDVIFIPEGESRTYAEMSPEEKNAISHRRRAFEDLRGRL
ncbi:MAG: RdgB/HAM1 family non-canonical purine NTP pyrophosphatase [Nitrospinaceae bacterium]|nr:RdgB/HAM1 family non-canonical purine NTP pyrophosphatase [Nitrospinaceae bacterium]NIR57659.1 RdgB/HAM1 family non-canonical purine NTP pyrophosphatase [Nitrospinaceae bacterium]NIS88134.1 RdgB/HAM1 family non-canonical purine NTP pyrophosphatase [Nitrospinaceae bacterium]NIT85001.1 RdgB/HAM1 family non-canonical purine NTP pyrophosphatase [Nitrospinaceae bacterium]NIU47170.1 RdgB/HAM1 family non-canonical purine NTP pyrophosphatase [Nitrospinaceae bacterium]